MTDADGRCPDSYRRNAIVYVNIDTCQAELSIGVPPIRFDLDDVSRQVAVPHDANQQWTPTCTARARRCRRTRRKWHRGTWI